MSRLILASKSAIRAQLLSGAGLDFETEGSGVDEDVEKSRMLASRVGPKGIAQALYKGSPYMRAAAFRMTLSTA